MINRLGLPPLFLDTASDQKLEAGRPENEAKLQLQLEHKTALVVMIVEWLS